MCRFSIPSKFIDFLLNTKYSNIHYIELARGGQRNWNFFCADDFYHAFFLILVGRNWTYLMSPFYTMLTSLQFEV